MPGPDFNAKDLAVLKKEKAKGRGMGLQDETFAPGKMYKARVGKSIRGTTAKSARGKTFAGYQKAFKTGVDAGAKTARATSTIIGVKPAVAQSLPKAASKFLPKRLKAIGLLTAATIGAGAEKIINKYKEKKDKNKKTLRDFREQKKPGVPSEKTKTINSALNKLKAKKMGGGMMQKPMPMYTKGGGADYMNTVKAKKRGNPAIIGKPKRTAGRDSIRPLPPKKLRLGGAGRDLAKSGPAAPLGKAGKGLGKGAANPKPKIKYFYKKKNPIKNVMVHSGADGVTRLYTHTRPQVDEKSGGQYKKHKSYNASPRLISDAQGKTFSLRSMNGGGSVIAKCKLGRNKPTKIT